MRASATSRISAHTAHAPSPAANSNKADDTSPFAMLLAATGATTAADQKKPAQDDGSQDDEAPTDQQQAAAQGDTADVVMQQIAQATPIAQTAPAAADAKPVKADDKDDTIKNDTTGTASVDPTVLPQVALALLQQPAGPQAAEPQTAAAPTDADSIDAAAATPAPADLNKAPLPAKDQAQAPAPATAQARATMPAADPETDDTDTDTRTKPDQTQASVPGDGTGAQPQPAIKPDASAAKPEAAKTGAATPKNGKDAPAKASTAKSGDRIPDEGAKPATQAAASAPAPTTADKPVAAQGTIAANTIAPPAAPQAHMPNAAAPTAAQHVQVTAHVQPNMPALAVEIAAKSQAGARQFDIRLDPPELGRVEVRLSIDATGKASAHLTADQPQTLDLLRKDSTSLTQALRDAGLEVNQDGLNFSLRQQAGDSQQGQRGTGGRSLPRGQMLTASRSLDATAVSAAYRAPVDGRLDIKV